MKIDRPIYDRFNPSPWGAHAKIVQLVGNNKKVLDVGCATGVVAREACQKILVGDIETMDLEELTPLSFDVLLMADVLEHLKEPLETLRKLAQFLSEEGFTLIVLPNIAHLYFRLKLLIGQFDYQEKGTLDRTHLRFYTLKTAKRLVADAGFQVEFVDVSVPNVPTSLAFNRNFAILYKSVYHVARFWKTGLAFQFIIKAKKQPSNIT